MSERIIFVDITQGPVTIELRDKTCLNCERFKEDEEICEHYGQRPPARVIAFGCETYLALIPF